MTFHFNIQESGSTPIREIWAGCTTFLAMAYIVAVNPDMLAIAGMPKEDVFTATCLAAGIASAVMGLWAGYPIALAPGMGLNAFFVFGICKAMGAPWQVALSAVFIAGLVFLVLSLTGIRERLLKAVPPVLVAGCAGGIGLFIALIGLQHAGIVTSDPNTMLTMGDLAKGATPYAAAGILITFILAVARVPGSLLLGIAATWALLIFGGQADLPSEYFKSPSFPKETLFQALTHMHLAFSPKFFGVILALVFVDLFDTMGTLLALITGAGLHGEGKGMSRLGRAFTADAIGTIVGGLLGTSTVTSYIESGSGISAGGRTGLTALVVAILFLLALPMAPLLTAVPGAATAPALVMVGVFLLAPLSKINLDDPMEAAPLLVMLLGIPACYSIEKGLGFGFIAYVVCRLARGRIRDVSPVVWLIALAFAARFIFLPHI